MKKLFISIILSFSTCSASISHPEIVEDYLWGRIAYCAMKKSEIYFTQGKDSSLYYYYSGRLDSYYDSLHHTLYPKKIDLKLDMQEQEDGMEYVRFFGE